jgi:GPH family glycoside/pentoside/hexuronide:cation symporter
MSDNRQKLSVGEKLGYSFGDAAANFVFQTLMVFQLSFYTDTFGLTAAAAGLLLLIPRFSDGFFDLLFGVLADRTKTRFGKFRPWVLATALPYGIIAVLAFSTPDISYNGKLMYAYVTYMLLMLIYSANNLPYSALSGVMTGDMGERTSLSSYRFFFAISASFVIQAMGPAILQHFSHGAPGHYDAHAYQVMMGIFGTLSVIFFVITFVSTKERIAPPVEQDASIEKDLKGLVKNGPWWALFALTIFVFITLSMRGSTMIYYFQYYVKRPDLFGWFNGVSQGTSLVGILFSKPLAMRFGKKAVFIVGLGITAALTAGFMMFGAGQLSLMFVTEGVRSLAYGFTIPLLWAMMADVADYSEWKTGRRATGIVFSAIVFGLKAGLGFGGSIAGWLLGAYGYVANADQSATALDGIRLTSSLYASIPFFIGVVCLFFYGINKPLNIQITDELTARRKQPDTALPAIDSKLLVEAP